VPVPSHARRSLAMTTLAVALLAAGAPTAVDAVPTSAQEAADLDMNIYPSDGPAQYYKLICEPTGGDHPDPNGACLRLSEIHGDLEQIREGRVPCRLDSGPVEVIIQGYWDGGSIDYFYNEYPSWDCVRASAGPIIPTPNP
jgi:hypothetical protein